MPALGALGPEYWEVVEPATFPRATLHFRNNDLLRQLGLDPAAVADAHLEQAYGRFEARASLLAHRYAMGGGFLDGQLRDRYGQLQGLGSKGSPPLEEWLARTVACPG